MLLRPLLQPLLRPLLRSPLELAMGFWPASLFANGEQGVWYDPSDFSSMYQDSAGSTPVTAVEQPVGLMLDKRLGPREAALTFDAGFTQVAGTVVDNGNGTYSLSENTNCRFKVPAASLVNGSSYECSAEIVAITGAVVLDWCDVGATSFTTTGNKQIIAARSTYDATFRFMDFATGAGQTATIRPIAVRRVPGNHATQATAASRPVLSARYNLLTKSEQLDDAAWAKTNSTVTANAATAPDGTLTADKVVESATLAEHYVTNTVTGPVAGTYRTAVSLKQGERTFAEVRVQTATSGVRVRVNLATGAITNTAVVFGAAMSAPVSSIAADANGFWRVTIQGTSTEPDPRAMVFVLLDATTINYTGDGVSGVYVAKADLRPMTYANVGGDYQRVNTSTDYDTAGFPHYLKFDGVDDGMATGSIDFTATDKMTVWAGVHKASDAAAGLVVELGNITVGGFGLLASGLAAGTNRNNYSFRQTHATGGEMWAEAFTYTAPVSNVVYCAYDFAGVGNAAEISPRVNGAVPASILRSVEGTGTAAFINAPLYLFRRGGANTPLNGRFYGLIVRGAASSDSQIAAPERYIAAKMGVTL